ncbi:MAG: hypothetical protein WBW33_12350 [Bryobacteraceae bacterium]
MTTISAPIPRKVARPMSSADLRPSERRFLAALDQLRFGRIESVRIHRGELILDPWPTTVQLLKFVAAETDAYEESAEFELKKPIVELFAYIRRIDEGKILCLEVRRGVPFSMEVEHRPSPSGGHHPS